MDTINTSDEIHLKDWTKEEKFHLLQALKDIGSQDCGKICGYVKSKSENEVRLALDHYKKKIAGNPFTRTLDKRKRKIVNQPVIPLASWSKVLLSNRNFDELQTETATALRLIAEFEDKPLVCSEKVDFSKMYHMLADALEGKSLANDKIIKVVFEKCMVETAIVSKSFMRYTPYKQILKSVDMSEKDVNYFSKPTLNNEHATLRHIAQQRNYNPLNIHESNLISTHKLV